jgi:hypothetical protein
MKPALAAEASFFAWALFGGSFKGHVIPKRFLMATVALASVLP